MTARHVYVRGHGPGGRYKDHYPDQTLAAWAREIAKWRRQRRSVLVYFDNDQKSTAPSDAQRLLDLLDQRGVPIVRPRAPDRRAPIMMREGLRRA